MLDLRQIVITTLSDYKKHLATIEADIMFIAISCFNMDTMYAFCGKDEEGGWEFRFFCDEKKMEDKKSDFELLGVKAIII